MHRVVPLKQMQTEDRYSIVYFLRPNYDVGFNDTTGKQWSAKEWRDFKFDVFKSPSTLDANGQFLTRMMVENDRWVESGSKISVAAFGIGVVCSFVDCYVRRRYICRRCALCFSNGSMFLQSIRIVCF